MMELNIFEGWLSILSEKQNSGFQLNSTKNWSQCTNLAVTY